MPRMVDNLRGLKASSKLAAVRNQTSVTSRFGLSSSNLSPKPSWLLDWVMGPQRFYLLPLRIWLDLCNTRTSFKDKTWSTYLFTVLDLEGSSLSWIRLFSEFVKRCVKKWCLPFILCDCLWITRLIDFNKNLYTCKNKTFVLFLSQEWSFITEAYPDFIEVRT